MKGMCCCVAIIITLWTILHLKAFLWSHLPLKESAQDCLLAEDLTCDQITPNCYGRLGDDTIVFCEGKIQVGTSMLLLISWQGPEDGNRRSSCWVPKARSCHSKSSWLGHFGLISLYSHWKVVITITVANRAVTPDDPSLPKITDCTTNHTGPVVVTISLLLSTKTPCFHFLSFLSPVFPSPSP